jgi:hypothetical protein
LLKERIEQDLKQALKSREQARASILRLLLAEIHNQEIAKKKLTEDDILAVLGQSVKKHQDSITQFRAGSREDLATREEEELKIIKSYLPKPLTTEELKRIISEVVSQEKPEGMQDFGRVMQKLMPQVKGRADGKTVSELLKEELNQQHGL